MHILLQTDYLPTFLLIKSGLIYIIQNNLSQKYLENSLTSFSFKNFKNILIQSVVKYLLICEVSYGYK